MKLSESQLEQFRTLGYVKGGRILNDAQLTRLREEIESLFSELPAEQRPENVPSIHCDNSYFLNLFLSDAFVEVARQILGHDVAIFTTYMISKRPNDGLAVSWHQDGAFFPIDPMETFTLWLAVDDATCDNGCLRVLPEKTNEKKILEHRVDTDSGTTLPMSLDNLDLGEAVDIELSAGEFSLHDPFILHGSNPNHSTRRRCGITIKYIPTHVTIDGAFDSPTGFDWSNIKLYIVPGSKPGNNRYVNNVDA